MPGKIATIAALFVLSLLLALPANAQANTFDLSGLSSASAGSQGNTTYKTGQGPIGPVYAQISRTTNPQIPGALPPTTTVGLAPIFGWGSGYYIPYAGSDAYGGGAPAGYGGAPQPFTASQLAQLASAIPGTAFAQNHPRRSEVLEGASNLYNQVVADQSQLGANALPLETQALNIADQEQAYALQNEGFITRAQQAQLNQEEAVLGQQITTETGF